MEKLLQSPHRTPIQPERTVLNCKTPPLDQQTDHYNSQNSIIDSRKNGTPDRLKVDPNKAFKYPERYTSPTDLMMSPVSKGLLARNRKAGSLLPPTKNQPRIQDSIFSAGGSLSNLKHPPVC